MTACKVLITGAGGMLATALELVLKKQFVVIPLTEKQLDITDKEMFLKIINSIKPNVIINTAANTLADNCEENRETAMLVNGIAVGYVAQAAKMVQARLIHISTDYVFDGVKKSPYTENDKPNPISVYGLSKLKGEQELIRFTDNYLIIRTQWLFGENGKNFADTIIRLARQKNILKIVDDQYGCPTYTKDLAIMIKWFIENENIKGEVFNFSNEGTVSRYGFAREILKLAGISTKLMPVNTSAYPVLAKRPHNSALDKAKIKKITNMYVRPWYNALFEYIKMLDTGSPQNSGKIVR